MQQILYTNVYLYVHTQVTLVLNLPCSQAPAAHVVHQHVERTYKQLRLAIQCFFFAIIEDIASLPSLPGLHF